MALRQHEQTAFERFRHYHKKAFEVAEIYSEKEELIIGSLRFVKELSFTYSFVEFPGRKIEKDFPAEWLFLPVDKLNEAIEEFISKEKSKLFKNEILHRRNK